MKLSDKTIGIIGLGKSGHGLIDYLNNKAKKVVAFDSKVEAKNNYDLDHYKNVDFHFGQNPRGDEAVDLIIISPGISLDHDFVQKFIQRGVEVIGEVELAFRLTAGSFIGITGTNGKTTTTALTGKMFKDAGRDPRIVGNIGNPIISEIESAGSNTVFVAELSSFQLETAKNLRCKAATIINITPDHLDRHKTMENYGNIKAKIYQNQDNEDFAIINVDDPLSLALGEQTSAQKIYVSVSQMLDGKKFPTNISIQNNKIILSKENQEFEIIDLEDIPLKGKHNYENVLCAIGLALAYEIDIKSIALTLKHFTGVEHRLEFVRKVKEVSYINDSKGTNPDASIKAVEAIEKDIILIAGGYDKNSNFDKLVSAFDQRVKLALIMGETKEKIKCSFKAQGFERYIEVNNMEEAVEMASKIAEEGDTVLLSPACASWDMYTSFEQRGEHFKALVDKLG